MKQINVYLILPCDDLMSLTAKRNWMVQTRRQQRLSDRVIAHNANVTSYKTTYSDGDKNSNWYFEDFSSDAGDIFSKKTRDKSARRSETRQRRPSDVIIPWTPASLDMFMNLVTLAGSVALNLFPAKLVMFRPPFETTVELCRIPPFCVAWLRSEILS